MASQPNRQTVITIALGSEQVRPIRVEAFETLSQPFMISVDLVSDFEIDFLPHLAKPAMVESKLDGTSQRYFHGLVIDSRSIDDPLDRGYAYRLTLAPTAHFHEQGRNFRIFQDMSVIDIVKQVLTQCKIDHETKLSGSTPTRTYCVQFGESDFAFVSRLLEQYGLYYFYRHEQDQHVMVICDAKSSHEDLEGGKLTFNPNSAYAANADSEARSLTTEGKYVTEWHEHVSSGAEAKVTLRDYDFQKPETPVESAANEGHKHAGGDIEVYGWPGRYYDKSIGTSLAEYQLEARRALRVRYEATSFFTGIQAGFRVQLADHNVDRFNRKYLVISVRTTLAAETYSSGSQAGETLVQFAAIPDDVQFRAPALTPQPVARGPETAVVTGPQNEEIHTDKYGRVKVQFHWDRVGKLDDNSSCWLRVSQTGGLGNIILPRVGHEVLIDFINGDPDRPIVVGRVFNESHMPVYKLPDNKTRALWRTKTYTHGSSDPVSGAETLDTGDPQANELRFEDLDGKEEVFIHAQRDMTTRVRNNETYHIGKDTELKVGKNRVKIIGVDEKNTIKGKQTEEITGDRSVSIKSNDKLDVSQKIAITAGQEITLTVGGSSIKMTTSSITIKAPTISIEATGQLTAKGGMTNVEASGVLVVKGATVNIN